MRQGLKNFYHFLAAIFATIFFRFPAKNLIVIGVTGTDGKTTTVNLIYEILKKAGKNVSMISSVGAKINGKDYDLPFHVTTPSSWQLQRFIKMIKDMENMKDKKEKGKYLVLEVTSHALDQNRVWGIPFRIGVLTNITHEHLDYHKTYKAYASAKMKLFKKVEYAVLNKNYKSYKNYKGKTITYGLKDGDITSEKFSFQTSLPGDYNQQNCLAAICAARILGIPDKIIHEGIRGFGGVEGRFEMIDSDRGYQILIDFAHTPNALEQLLSTVKPKVKGKIIHVFGCAGLRDFTKRPLMGKISAQYDDAIILTEEDYRTEDINKIMEEIENGIYSSNEVRSSNRNSRLLTSNNKLVFKISDRQEAINKAIKMAKKGDWVVLTGKGHEKSLCRGKTEFPWSEREAVMKALNSL